MRHSCTSGFTFPIETLIPRHVLKCLMNVSVHVYILYMLYAKNRSLIWGSLYVLRLDFQMRNKWAFVHLKACSEE